MGAADYYQYASDRGIAQASYNIGYFYDVGVGRGLNSKKAAQFYKLAINQLGNDWAPKIPIMGALTRLYLREYFLERQWIFLVQLLETKPPYPKKYGENENRYG